ncbi:TrmB family transcriptional regulator [Halococcoides cellulosivorans]|uniref:TrmB family transcriptional regulator n=1 Tax=Halococcoides cellulosivorans TaxID=1679096 RepID=A0A2R4X0J7_9EURY|nr:TrmB family transcriptional regulator sugar-binding domain-containing protein [Halococcoides cellulosivorans]AWB27320.1 TrmB family transcriptional regulator [Halococcoides cellulosivorans]
MTAAIIRQHLTTFGLSEKEIDAYLAVLRSGTKTTGDLADSADVSTGYIYDVVQTLSDRKLVTIDESTSPTTVRARPPDEVSAEFTAQIEDLEGAIEDAYGGGDEPAGFEIVRSRSTVRRRARSAIETADGEVFVVVPATEFAQLKDVLSDAVDRGVIVYLMLVPPGVSSTLDDLDDPGEVSRVLRTWSAKPPVTVIADETRGVVGPYAVLSGRHGEESALSFTMPTIAGGFLGNIMSNVWPMGDTEFISAPDPLPHTYGFFRSSVTNAALHQMEGHDLAADLVVQNVESGDREHHDDIPIVEVRQSLVGDPTTAFPTENSLVVEIDGERRAVGSHSGGFEPFFETYAAVEVTLQER